MSKKDSNSLIRDISKSVKSFKKAFDTKEVGRVVSSGDGIIKIEGLRHCRYGELLDIDGHLQAIALNIEESQIGAIVLGDGSSVGIGALVHATGGTVTVPVGDALLGRVVNSLGRPIDGLSDIKHTKTRPIEAPAPDVVDRAKVSVPLYTGVLSIDSMIPIGRGQRELILGDRQTGKTILAQDTILNQKGKNVLCIYVAIGQKASAVSHIMHTLLQHRAMDYTTIVCSTASDSAPMQYIAPYVGCTIAEEWMYDGKDVLIIYDDLSKHAVAYRTMSLLLRRPVGREAYPGDTFYIHAKLLERSAQLSKTLGGGSMTALPIAETVDNNISAHIPTNLVSITDGQIFLDKELFNSGVRPAVNVGLSVSRVGSAAQIAAMKKVSYKLRLDLAQYKELAIFAQFGTELDETTRQAIEHGKVMTELLKQPVNATISVEDQVALLYIAMKGMLAKCNLSKLKSLKYEFFEYIQSNYSGILDSIRVTQQLDSDNIIELDKATQRFLEFY